MAKNKASQATTVTPDTQVDDLLDGTSAPGAEAQASETPTAEEVATETEEEAKQKALEAEIKAAQAKLKELKALQKGEKPKSDKVLKGQMVAFKNKAGETIVGLGVMYFVTRSNGKLHYKEASQVVILPADWKEGDALPALPEPAPKEVKAETPAPVAGTEAPQA